MRVALTLIVIGVAAFAVFSRDWIAQVTGLPFFGVRPAASLELSAQSSQPDLKGITKLQANVFNGHIRISVGPEPKLTLSKRGRVEVRTERQGDAFVITGRELARPCWRCEVSIDMTVPAGLELNLDTSNAPIEVRGAVHSLVADTSNGTIITQGTGKAELKLGTSNGRIEAEDAQGRVEAHTSNGRIRLSRIQGSVQAETSNSGIVLESVTLMGETSSTANTSNGSIEVIGLKVEGGLKVSGSTSNGGLRLQMPGFNVQQDRNGFTATKEGSPASQLRLETSNGGITIRP